MTKNNRRLKTFYVPLEASYYRKQGDNINIASLQGYIPLQATNQTEARQMIEEMLNRGPDPPEKPFDPPSDNRLQPCDCRIVWDDYLDGNDWQYEDFSLGVPSTEDATPPDWSVKPAWAENRN